MGLVEGIFGEIHHFPVNLQSHLFRNPPADAARHPFFRISVDEVVPFFFHHSLLLFAHGPAYQVAAAHGVAAQIPDDLHDLLLVDDAAVSRLQDRLELRAGIGDGSVLIFAADIFGNKIHGARTIQGNARDDVLQALRF